MSIKDFERFDYSAAALAASAAMRETMQLRAGLCQALDPDPMAMARNFDLAVAAERRERKP